MAYAPTLNPYLTADPMPRVEVLFTSFAAGTASVTVYRLSSGREYKVRGAVRAATAGALTRIDTEVPFGVAAEYRAEMFDATGLSLGFTSSATVTLNVTDMWIHNPLDPSGGVKLQFMAQAARELRRPVEGEVYYPQGRRVGVVIGGQRRGLSDVVLDVIADDLATADKFQTMLGTYSTTTVPVLCIRIGSVDRVRLPRPFFAAVLDAAEVDLTYALGGTQIGWAMRGDEVSPPAAGIVIPLLRNADLNAYFATNAAINSGNLTNLAVNRRYDLAGTA